jgi:hypothetical protein
MCLLQTCLYTQNKPLASEQMEANALAPVSLLALLTYSDRLDVLVNPLSPWVACVAMGALLMSGQPYETLLLGLGAFVVVATATRRRQ